MDKNTVAFYFTTVNGDDKYGVAIGYDKMSNVDKGTAFVAQTTKANLTDVVLFDAEGVAAEKDYAYVLGRTSSSSGYVTLNVLLMDGTASTLKLTKSDYDSLFKGNSDFETAYAYTVNGEGVADLTAPGSSGTHVLTGYAVKLNDGTVAVYSDPPALSPPALRRRLSWFWMPTRTRSAPRTSRASWTALRCRITVPAPCPTV